MSEGELYLKTAGIIQDGAHINDLTKQIKVHKLLDKAKKELGKGVNCFIANKIPKAELAKFDDDDREWLINFYDTWAEKWFGE